MAKAGEGLIRWHNARQERRQERHERHQVVTPAPPNQEHENEDQQRKKNDLVGRQNYAFPLLTGRIACDSLPRAMRYNRSGVLLCYGATGSLWVSWCLRCPGVFAMNNPG